MKISDLLQESQSQQLQEGPFTQAIGKVGGKIAKGVANVGKDLKTGFKAGYSGAQAAAPTAEPADTAAAPAAEPKQGILDKVKQAAADFKQGFQQGSGKPAEKEPAAAQAPAAEPEAKPAAEPVAQSNDNALAKMQADFEKHKEDTMTNLSMLLRRISALEKAAQPATDDNPNIVKSNNSIERTGNPVSESIQLFKR